MVSVFHEARQMHLVNSLCLEEVTPNYVFLKHELSLCMHPGVYYNNLIQYYNNLINFFQAKSP